MNDYENRFFGPIDWAELSDVIRFGCIKSCCEGCDWPHGQLVFHWGMGAGGMPRCRLGAVAGGGP